jgi:hypothetical protein
MFKGEEIRRSQAVTKSLTSLAQLTSHQEGESSHEQNDKVRGLSLYLSHSCRLEHVRTRSRCSTQWASRNHERP